MKDINFFKPYLGKNQEKINSKIYIYGSMIVVGILIIGSFAFNTYRIMSLDESINCYNEKLAAPEIQRELREAENVNRQIETLTEYDTALIDISNAVKDRDNVSQKLFKEISSTVPSEVSFKNLQIIENTILIKGISTNRTAVAELKHNLSKLSNMQDVFVSAIDTDEAVEGEYSFELKCVLKDVE